MAVNAALTGLAGMKFSTSDASKKATPVMYIKRLAARSTLLNGTVCLFMLPPGHSDIKRRKLSNLQWILNAYINNWAGIGMQSDSQKFESAQVA